MLLFDAPFPSSIVASRSISFSSVSALLKVVSAESVVDSRNDIEEIEEIDGHLRIDETDEIDESDEKDEDKEDVEFVEDALPARRSNLAISSISR